MKALLNGAVVPIDQAKVSVLDRGFLYGDAIFETLAVYRGSIFRLKQHWERFIQSAALLGIEVSFTIEQLRKQLAILLKANECENAILRVSLTRGKSQRGLSVAECREPTFLVLCFPPKIYPAALRQRGATMVVSTFRRTPDSVVPSAAKTANFLNGILAFREAASAGADEALLLTTTEEIAEGTVSNIFLVDSGTLITPSRRCGILPGITRAAVIELASTLGIPVREEAIPAAALDRATEIFYTNTTAGIMPVGRIGSRPLGSSRPVTNRLIEAYHALVNREAGSPWEELP